LPVTAISLNPGARRYHSAGGSVSTLEVPMCCALRRRATSGAPSAY